MKKNIGAFLFLLLMVLLAVCIYLFIQYSNLNNSIQDNIDPVLSQKNQASEGWQEFGNIMPKSIEELNDFWILRGDWELENNVLKTASEINQDQILVYNIPIQGDVAFEFKARVPDEEAQKLGGDISVILLSNKHLNRRYDLQAIVAQKKENSKALIQMINIPFAENKVSLEVGKEYQIRGESEGDSIRLYVDSKLVLETHNRFFLGGSFHGIYSWGAGKEFWDLKVYKKQSGFFNDPLKIADSYFTNALNSPFIDKSKFSHARKSYLNLLEITREYENKKELLKRLAVLERESKNYNQMKKYVDEYIAIDSSFQAQLLKAENLLFLKKEEEAIGLYKKCLELYPAHRFEISVSLQILLFSSVGEKISTVSKMKLWEMMLDNTLVNRLDAKRLNLESIGFLKKDRIKTLYFNWNEISNIDPLSIYQNLDILSLSNNKINDISVLKNIDIESLFIDFNPISKVDVLENKSIKKLFVSGLLATDFKAIGSLKKLESLQINSNKIDNFEFLSKLRLQNLGISSTGLKSLGLINGALLTKMDISGNPIDHFSALKFPALKELNIRNTNISDLNEISKLKLKKLNIDSSKIESLEPYYESPPKSFYFNSLSLSNAELIRASKKWKNNPDARSAYLLAKLYLLLRQESFSEKDLKDISHKGPDGHQYLPVPIKLNCEEARAFCQKYGGHLVSINSQRENLFVKDLHGFDFVWLGLHQKNERLEWDNEEPFYFHNFYRKNIDLYEEEMDYYSVRAEFDYWVAEKVNNDEKKCFVIEWMK